MPLAIDGREQAARELLGSWSSDNHTMAEMSGAATGDFAPEIGEIAFDNIFAKLWVRPGLDLRGRSLLTLGILIALRVEWELKAHLTIALRNGCTMEEIEEAIYHASAYAGYPAANQARRYAIEAFRAEGLVG